MKEKNTYYLILGTQVGKKENSRYYLYDSGKWVKDREFAIMDRLMRYDPTEPPGSPYGIGCTEVMNEIEVITEERAKELTGGMV